MEQRKNLGKQRTLSDWRKQQVACLFHKFTSEHSWYKRGEQAFCFIPCNGSWVIRERWLLNTKSSMERFHPVLKDNVMYMTPLMYTGGHGLEITMGGWGYPMFEWLEKHDYGKEAAYLKPFCKEIEAKDSDFKSFKMEVNLPRDQTEDPVLVNLFRREYDRSLELSLSTFAKLWNQIGCLFVVECQSYFPVEISWILFDYLSIGALVSKELQS